MSKRPNRLLAHLPSGRHRAWGGGGDGGGRALLLLLLPLLGLLLGAAVGPLLPLGGLPLALLRRLVTALLLVVAVLLRVGVISII